uniref:SLH domain-containing protein n=1 Tax=Planktothricoides sp. SpSt-374 TaxID=2282167 RepID=A0A7C3VN39_9CYAN
MQINFGLPRQKWDRFTMAASVWGLALTANLPLISTAVAQNEPMEEMNSVSELADVRPSDWAYSALQGLADRYGCLLAYPDGTYKGNQALTRYQFAAGVDACLNAIQTQIASAVSEISSQDLQQMQRLQEEFAAELATMRARVDGLEVRTAELEGQQFSATTKLVGTAIFSVTDAWGDGTDMEPSFQERVRLLFNSSFTGNDLLISFIQVGNSDLFNLPGETGEGTLTSQVLGDTDNEVALAMAYVFPLSEQLKVSLVTNTGVLSFFTPTVNPYFDDLDDGTTSISTFAQHNPIYRLGAGAALALNYKVSDSLTLTGGYSASEGPTPEPGKGLFNGNYAAIGQLTWKPAEPFAIGLTYINSYFGTGDFAYGFGTDLSYVGTDVANTLNGLRDNFPVVANSYGVQTALALNPKVALSGWVGLTKARLIGLGDADIWTYAVGLALPDLGKQGNLGGLIVGSAPTLRGLDVPGSPSFNHDWAYHVEGFYKYQATDHISVTPGLIWLPAPNQDQDNPDVFMGTLRTTLSF